MQLGVETDGLRDGVAALEEALARLDRVRPGDDMAPVASAFRGGETAAWTGRACTVWYERLSGLACRMRATGAALDVAAAGYDAVERVAQRALAAPGSR